MAENLDDDMTVEGERGRKCVIGAASEMDPSRGLRTDGIESFARNQSQGRVVARSRLSMRLPP